MICVRNADKKPTPVRILPQPRVWFLTRHDVQPQDLMRAMVYDQTTGWLSRVWASGSVLYRGMRRLDAAHAATDWDGALRWLGTLAEPIREVQFWMHGKWGCAVIDSDVLDASDLSPASARRPLLDALRERLAPDALVWFRTCETFGAKRGIDFAERLADFLGARVAGHTYVIGFHQSGLHGLAPGRRAHWSADEGLLEGTADAPRCARQSAAGEPHTITCLRGRVPERWFE